MFILFRQCSSVFVLSRQCPFGMLYLCIVFERPKLRVRVLTIFPTCTSKISYVYPHPGPLRHKSSLTLLTGRPIVLKIYRKSGRKYFIAYERSDPQKLQVNRLIQFDFLDGAITISLVPLREQTIRTKVDEHTIGHVR